jgi:hypothetical protein
MRNLILLKSHRDAKDDRADRTLGSCRDNLKVFLEGFRGTDKVVKEEDIQLFVAGMRERAEKR